MLRLHAARFLRACDSITALRLIANRPEVKPDDLVSFADLQFDSQLRDLANDLESFGMRFTLASVKKLLEEIPAGTRMKASHLKSRIEDIGGRMDDELQDMKFFCVRRERAELVDSAAPLLGADVDHKFSSAAFDIEEAGRCLALERNTASVFHCKRIVELAIKAVCKCLGIPDPVRSGDRNWGSMLRNIKAENERRRKRPDGWPSVADADFFEEIYVSLDAVRNVWRNATMHVEKKYTTEEAEHIWRAVGGLMRKLASRLDEHGQPGA